MNVSGIEIPELKPDGMEEAIECYALLALNRGILPKIGDAISSIAFDTIDLPDSMGSLSLSASTAVPHNPGIEANQIKTFINLDNITLNIQVSPGGGSSPGGEGRRSSHNRDPDGPAENADGDLRFYRRCFRRGFWKDFHCSGTGIPVPKAGSGSFGPFTASDDVAAHLEGGTLEMRDDGTIVIKELDVKWDRLRLSIGIDIPEFCPFGGGEICVLPPWPDCDVPLVGCGECVTLDPICVFSSNPDISIPIDLTGSSPRK